MDDRRFRITWMGRRGRWSRSGRGDRLPRGIAVRTALVHDGDVAPELAENRYVDFLVPVERLFGMP